MKRIVSISCLSILTFWVLLFILPAPGFSQAAKDSAAVFGFLRDVSVNTGPLWAKVELTGDGLGDFRSFTLVTPPRLVIDFPGVLSSFPKKFIEVEHSLLKDVRLGQHPEKLRLVLTFPAGEVPRHRIAWEAGGVTILVGKVEKDPAEQKKPEAKEKPERGATPSSAEKTPPEKKPSLVAVPPAKVSEEKGPTPPPIKPEPEKPAVKIYTGEKITLDFTEADIRRVFQLISEAARQPIVPGPEVQGTVSLRLIDVPWDQALDSILSIYNLKRVDEGNLIRILPREKS